MTTPPVALILFRRPALTARVFAAVRAARPARLFLIADGPRPDRPDDQAACAAARAAVAAVDWPCAVSRIYAEANLGVRRRVESGLDAVFAAVDRAVILEDDCLPAPGFLPFCAELLERYADDERVVAVAGSSHLRRPPRRHSYFFSRYPNYWGWASWARAWRRHDPRMAAWPALRDGGWLEGLLADRRAARAWRATFDAVYAGRIETWDYRWVFSCWLAGGLAALPAANLVSNMGNSGDSTHTRSDYSPFANLPLEDLPAPLRHPPAPAADPRVDGRIDRRYYHPDLAMRLVWRARRLLGLRRPPAVP